jgi:uracil-DNA glycosylase
MPASRSARSRDLAARADEAARCTRCALYERATQTVFGEGSVDASMLLVGEQPGDREDLAGRPFVGPAGGILASIIDGPDGVPAVVTIHPSAVLRARGVDRAALRRRLVDDLGRARRAAR